MSTNLKVINGQKIIKATPSGELAFDGAKELISEIAAACMPLPDHVILLDLRKALLRMSIADLRLLANELSKHRPALYRKFAVVCPRGKYDDLAFFAVCAQNRGFIVRVFSSNDGAIEWVTSERP